MLINGEKKDHFEWKIIKMSNYQKLNIKIIE